jgi:hypothetical protein
VAQIAEPGIILDRSRWLVPDRDGRVQIGIAGAARITSAALIKPAKPCDRS